MDKIEIESVIPPGKTYRVVARAPGSPVRLYRC